MTTPDLRAVRLNDIPDPGPTEAGADLDTYLHQFSMAWWCSANQDDPMPHNWRAHVAMLHANRVPIRELLRHVNTVCAPDFDHRWCCLNCSFAHVIELCADNLGDLARFGLDKEDRV